MFSMVPFGVPVCATPTIQQRRGGCDAILVEMVNECMGERSIEMGVIWIQQLVLVMPTEADGAIINPAAGRLGDR